MPEPAARPGQQEIIRVPDDVSGMPPPAGLSRRVAEVTQALIEAHTCLPPGWCPTVGEIRPYDVPGLSWQQTAQALDDARDAGLADTDGNRWWPGARAGQLRAELEDWYYGT